MREPPPQSRSETTAPTIPDYAELRCVSNFTFLRGASRPEELVERAVALGYRALALTDECSLAGIVRAHVAAKEQAAKEHGLRLLVGAEFQVDCAFPFTLVVLACNFDGYGNLCQFITQLRRSSAKGNYRLAIDAVAALPDCVVIACPRRMSSASQ